MALSWVIDGFDEAIHADALIKLFADLQSSSLPIHILLVSRKLQALTSAIHRLEKCIPVSSFTIQGNHDYIESYIKEEMFFNNEALAYRDEIASKILQGAQGNFLWIHIAMERINQCHTREDVEAVLKDLPPVMEAMYARMYSSLQTHNSCRKKALGLSILAWAVYSTRLLSIEELHDALAHDVLDIKKTVTELCEGLVTGDAKGRVMIHETAREYLSRCGSGETPLLEPKPNQNTLYRRFIKCLMQPELREQISRNKSPALLKYAASSWSSNLHRGTTTSLDNLLLLQGFLMSSHALT